MYGYYAQYCVCADEPVGIGMANLLGVETTTYPVDVFNVNGVLIGQASTKAEYITLWNSDAANQVIGTLSAGSATGPFRFKLLVNTGQEAPDYVFGVPLAGRAQLGIYAFEYDEDEYE